MFVVFRFFLNKDYFLQEKRIIIFSKIKDSDYSYITESFVRKYFLSSIKNINKNRFYIQISYYFSCFFNRNEDPIIFLFNSRSPSKPGKNRSALVYLSYVLIAKHKHCFLRYWQYLNILEQKI